MSVQSVLVCTVIIIVFSSVVIYCATNLPMIQHCEGILVGIQDKNADNEESDEMSEYAMQCPCRGAANDK